MPDQQLSHIAFIMDGNRRWAAIHNKSKVEGYKQGILIAEQMILLCKSLGIEYITIYSFSTENWFRPAEETEELMQLFMEYLDSDINRLTDHDIEINFIGDLENLPKNLYNKILRKVDILKENKIHNQNKNIKNPCKVNIAVNYGAKDEIVRAINKLLSQEMNSVEKFQITEQKIEENLDTYLFPPPDLLIRSGGNKRISNFLLWQLAYAELYFSNTLWPSFQEKDLLDAIEDFNSRTRNYGS